MAEVVRLPSAAGGGKGPGRHMGDSTPGLTGIKALGYDDRLYTYLSAETQQLVHLTPEQHVGANLLVLLLLEGGRDAFPAGKRSRAEFDLSAARAACMKACHAAGIFDPERVRGRGVWWGDGL